LKFPKNWEEFENDRIAKANYHRQMTGHRGQRENLNALVANNGAQYIKRKVFEKFGFEYWYKNFSTQRQREIAFMKEFDKIGAEQRTKRFRKAKESWQSKHSAKKNK
jgi:hypothetical protein